MAPVDSTDRVREAKIFLASRIAEEAERKGVPLNEIERKMLYYSESGWTLDDIAEVSVAFSRELDRNVYEKRVAALIRSLRARLRAARGDEYQIWNRAISVLKSVREEKKEGHYILTLIARAQPTGEISRLVITALVVIGVLLLAVYLATRGY